jgi:phosphopantetheinyl transferase
MENTIFRLDHSEGEWSETLARIELEENIIHLSGIEACVEQELFAERFFLPAQFAASWAFPKACGGDASPAIWTCKEADAKALGGGLWLDGTSFDAPSIPSQEAQSPASIGPRWSILTFAPAPGYVAVIACQGKCSLLRIWKWSISDSEAQAN